MHFWYLINQKLFSISTKCTSKMMTVIAKQYVKLVELKRERVCVVEGSWGHLHLVFVSDF